MKRITEGLIIILILTIIPVSMFGQKYTAVDKWLVLGSFSDNERSNLHKTAFINESMASPAPGDKAGDLSWQVINRHSLDFTSAGFKEITNAVAYALTYIYSKENQLATLYLGSDDGSMVWVNGYPVWDKIGADRALRENEDVIALQLFRGYNRVLVKVEQGGGGWGLICNLDTPVPVTIGTDHPSENEMARALDVQIIHTDLVLHDRVADFRVTAKNFGSVVGGESLVGLKDRGNTLLADKKKISLPAGNSAIVSFSFSLPMAAGMLSDPGTTITLTHQGVENSLNLPGSLGLDLFLKLSSDPSIADEETRLVAGQLQLVKDVYGTTAVSDKIVARALQDVAEEKYYNLAEAYRQLLESQLKNVPDHSADTIHITGHAHMDMNWLWTFPESEKMFHDNIRQVVAFMEQFDDFTMLQSQATIYKSVELIDPPLFEKVTRYVKEGRFEPVGGMWTEGDCNLTGGEALCRSFLLGQRYFYDHFGRIAHVGWLPDNFGHISQFPQILNLAGCSYYYFMRCNPLSGTFWWQGPDHSKVLCFSGNSYNNSITPEVINEIDRLSPQHHRIFIPTGVGDHGGGPTLDDIQMIHKLDSTPRFPSIRFTSAEDFFTASKAEMKDRPTHLGEMQYIFEGCYTSVAEIKENTRRSEQSLYRAEFLSCLRWMFGEEYPAEDLRNLWEIAAFNQFHDILPGSAIYESYHDAVADHKMVQKKSNAIFETGFRHLADEIAFKSGTGQPLVVLNMQPREGKVLVEAEVFSYAQPRTASLTFWSDFYGYNNVKPVNGPAATVMVRDDAGNEYPAQITGGKASPPGFRTRIQFVVDHMPAGGYKTFYADVSEPGSFVEPIHENDGAFETDYFLVAFDMKNGDIISLKDKRTSKEFVPGKGRLNKLTIYLEEPNGMNAWTIGAIEHVEDVTRVESVAVTENGPVRATVEVTRRWGKSKFIQRTYIYKSYPRIDFDLEAHWLETGDGVNPAPFLRATFDLDLENPTFANHVPFDVVERPTNGQEVPAQQWVDLSDGESGIALLNRTKFGHSVKDGQLRLSLLRATYYPNLYPNLGINHIQYSLFPHAGDWKNGVWAEADNFNIPVYAAEPPSLALANTHATRDAEASFMKIVPSGVVLSGMKLGEEGDNLVIRLAEVNGEVTTATITLPVGIRQASRVNLLEFPQESPNQPVVSGEKVSVKLNPHEIVTLSVIMK
jgi:alpha-mannosidase